MAMTPKLNFNIGSMVDPYRPLQSAVDSVAGIMKARQDSADKNKLLAAEQANKDRNYAIQKAQADRLDREDQRLLAIRQAGVDIAGMDNTTNQAFDPALQNALHKGYENGVENKTLDATEYKDVANINSILYGDTATKGQSAADFASTGLLKPYQAPTETAAAKVMQRDPIAFENQARSELQSRGIAGADADAIISSEMKKRYPVASAESIAENNKILKTVYDQNMGILKKQAGSSGGISVNEDGTLSIGGANKIVRTDKDSPELIAKTIDDIHTDKDLSGKFSGWLFGEERPTKGNLYKTYTVLKHMGYDDTQIATGMRSGVSENWLTDDALADPATIAKYMGNPTGTSQRTTSKGGGASGGALLGGKDAAQLTKEYLANSRANIASGLQSRFTQSDIEGLLSPQKAPAVSKEVKSDKILTGNKSKSVGGKEDSYMKGDPTDADAVDTVTSQIENDKSNHEYGVDFTADLNQIRKNGEVSAEKAGGILSTMFDYANKASIAVDNYFDSDNKKRTPAKPGTTMDKITGSIGTSLLNLLDGSTPSRRVEDDAILTKPTSSTKEDLVSYTNELNTKEGQKKAIDDALQMISGPSMRSAKMMSPGVEGKFVTDHVGDILSKGGKNAFSSIRSVKDAVTNIPSKLSTKAQSLSDKVFGHMKTKGTNVGTFHKRAGTTSHFPQKMADEVGHILSKGTNRSASDATRLQEILNAYPTLHKVVRQYL